MRSSASLLSSTSPSTAWTGWCQTCNHAPRTVAWLVGVGVAVGNLGQEEGGVDRGRVHHVGFHVLFKSIPYITAGAAAAGAAAAAAAAAAVERCQRENNK